MWGVVLARSLLEAKQGTPSTQTPLIGRRDVTGMEAANEEEGKTVLRHGGSQSGGGDNSVQARRQPIRRRGLQQLWTGVVCWLGRE
jgi:hypothetical protein